MKRCLTMLPAILILSAQGVASATSLDHYEIKGRMENVQTIYMPEPQIILGRRDEKHDLFKGDEPGKRLAQRAIFHAASDAFAQQGYVVSSALDDDTNFLSTTDYQEKLSTAWKHLDQFADAGMEKKPKLWPFTIAPDHNGLLAGKEIDAIAFVQCYGKFDSVATPDAEVTSKAIIATAELALLGSAIIFKGYSGSGCLDHF